jgi:hypothetical protein
MKKFSVKTGVNSFETGGPAGLITVSADKPLSTDDPAVISILEEHGAHALEVEEVAPATEKPKGGDRS